MGDIIPSEEKSVLPYSVIDYLIKVKGFEVDLKQRTAITATCHDADYIPKAKNAGKVFKTKDGAYQVMHNGLKVTVDGYYGTWMTELITKLHGHHEPQEEKVFYELSKHFRPHTAMIELGSYWSFYSLWFHQVVAGARNICCEPDPLNRAIGETNFNLNNFTGVQFVSAAAGKNDKQMIEFDTGRDGKPLSVPIRTVDSLVKEFGVDKLEVLHIDVQGAEYEALEGAQQTITSGTLRFVFVSTHHFLISRDPNMHARCLEFITKLGGHIICEHEIHESYSGDGLIVASFDKKDQKLHVDVSDNRMSASQFRSYTKDLELVFAAYDMQLERLTKHRERINELSAEVAALSQQPKRNLVNRAAGVLRTKRGRR